MLCKILARQYSVGGYKVELVNRYDHHGAFLDNNSRESNGFLVESTYPDSDMLNNYFKTLTVSVGTGVDNLKLVLRGTATAQRDGEIADVRTNIELLGPSTPPSSTYENVYSSSDFTESLLSSPVNLTTGQMVTVTVVISFS